LNWHGAKMTIATHIVWHKDKWMSPAMQAFLDVMKARLEERSAPALVAANGAG
jgi:DNA-binding transcriptional LysR family regulator